MSESTHLGLPFLEAGQAQKHVTHNEALRLLDAVVHLSVVAVSPSAPGSPTDGERYLVGASPSGDFSGKSGQVAIYEDGAWRFLTPRIGWRAWNEDDQTLLLWNGNAWIVLDSGGEFDPDNVDHLYLNDAAPGDVSVKLAMRGESALLHAIPATDSGSGDVRLQISKETSADTASVFFATNFSGRAEFGLAGSDNFKLKMSPDGSSWIEALDIDKATGRVRLPPALALTDADQVVAKRHVRELLTGNRTYYVRTDGSNSNNGLSNTSGGAFLTIQKALDVVFGTLDLYGYDVTIQIGSGTYSGAVSANSAQVGKGTIKLLGNAATPSNVVIATTSSDAVTVSGGARLTIQGVKLQTTTAGHGLVASGGTISLGDVEFGACAGQHMRAIGLGDISAFANYAISGGATYHFAATGVSSIRTPGRTVTISNTPAFTAFALAERVSYVQAFSMTFSGSGATGARYFATKNGLIESLGGGSYFPGSTLGSVSDGGTYV